MSTSSISAPLLSQSLPVTGPSIGPATGPGSAIQSATGTQDSGTKADPRVHKAAQQFEALMIGEMMKTVREGGEEGWLGSGGETGDDTAIGMAESQFSQAMASNGGLGLAHMIEQTVARQHGGQHQDAATPAPDKLSIGPR